MDNYQVLILSIIWQYFKIRNKRKFFENYFRNFVTLIDFVLSIFFIVLSVFTIYKWVILQNIPEYINEQDIAMLAFLSGIIMFYLLRTIILFLKESDIKIKRLFFYLSVIFETGLPLYFTILDFVLR
ncbi:hypothetical protein [Leptotrichia sp. oral taxon 223]|uniref:hypothetical protein n=1 Tax=Leptotrichia sp. oral taxon 223 TaxID=712363 RepID=UPI0015B7AEA4|nr:hypothetical protein [Leptotrichia sp. oral taxon 223]NWO20051.1 hypothetical protein [Leptotrichia sp. oral taxon 223]